jgi:transcriptional regulator with XRE-family HTH domain
MNDVQQALINLLERGWSIAAIADEMGTHRETVSRWKHGHTYPAPARPVVLALEGISRRGWVPKRKRYNKKPPSAVGG